MKKIIFFLPHMLGRGVEKSLLSLLEYLPRDEFEIQIALVQKEGEFMPLIPTDIKTVELDIPKKMKELVNHPISGSAKIMSLVKHGHFITIGEIFYRKYIKKDPLAGLLYSFHSLSMFSGEYDLAICYHMHCPFLIRYVADKVNSKRKAIWIHNDFSNTRFPVRQYMRELQYYDKIFAVSKQCADEFCEQCPEYAEKVDVFYNYLSLKSVMSQSELGYPKEILDAKRKNKKVILSVGRLEKMKGFDLAIQVAAQLKEKNIDFRWFLLGTGSETKLLETMIENYNLNDYFVLCGAKNNPYPWYKNSDLMVIPSRHEGFSIVLMEARALNLPAVATDFAGAKEQIIQNGTGIVVEHDIDEIVDAVVKLLNDTELLHKMRSRLLQERENINDKMQINKLKDLV